MDRDRARVLAALPPRDLADDEREQVVGSEPHQETGKPSGQPDQAGLREELAANVATPCADRLHHADLAHALVHGGEERVRDAERRHCDRDGAEPSEDRL